MKIDDLTGKVIRIAMEIHSGLGPGCYEKVYEDILYCELIKAGIPVERQIVFPVRYRNYQIQHGYKVDLLIDNRLIIELKTCETLADVHFRQIKTYLYLSNLKHGLILHFNVAKMKDGIYRIFNNFGRERMMG